MASALHWLQVPGGHFPQPGPEEVDAGHLHQANLQREDGQRGEGDPGLTAGWTGPSGPGCLQHQQVPGLLRGGGQVEPDTSLEVWSSQYQPTT